MQPLHHMNSPATALAVVGVLLAGSLRPNDVPSWLSIDFMSKDPNALFRSFLIVTVSITSALKVWRANEGSKLHEHKQSEKKIPDSLKALQIKFLAVFWLLRAAFWMAGPYFYAAYASKVINGKPMSIGTISYISLAGFGAPALLGPLLGRLADIHGKKFGTILGILLYAIGNWSVLSNKLWMLFAGRAMAGLGQSLLSNAPEGWFVVESKRSGRDPGGDHLAETFGLAYAIDSVVAIFAGQLASLVASYRGPAGPYLFSPLFLLVGLSLVLHFWEESTGASETSAPPPKRQLQRSQSVMNTCRNVLFDNPKIICLGMVQAFFEASMYIFVVTWAPSMKKTIENSFGEDVATPYGMAFSCFMAACMLGTTIFSWLVKILRLEGVATLILVTSAASLACSVFSLGRTGDLSVLCLFLSFMIFEMCVGLYFPSIGTLRGSYLPSESRGVLMTLFAVPQNGIVVTVLLFLKQLGHQRALVIAMVIISIAALAMAWLYYDQVKEERLVEEQARKLMAKAQETHRRRRSRLSKILTPDEVMEVSEEVCPFDRRMMRASFASASIVIN